MIFPRVFLVSIWKLSSATRIAKNTKKNAEGTRKNNLVSSDHLPHVFVCFFLVLVKQNGKCVDAIVFSVRFCTCSKSPVLFIFFTHGTRIH